MSDQTMRASAGAVPATETIKRAQVREREEARTASRGERKKFSIWVPLIYLFLIVMAIFALAPIYYVVQASLRGDQTLYSTDLKIFPTHPTLDNYSYVLGQIPFVHWVINTTIVCGLATALGLFFSTTGAYALARFRFRGRQLTLVALLAIQAFPALLALLAYYLLLQSLHLLDSNALFGTGPLLALAVVYAGGTVVFGCWNIKGYFDTLPVELEKAALVDGATPTRAFLRITLPLAAPALAASALFAFIGGWNEFALANIILNSNGAGGEGLGTNITFALGMFGLQNNFRVPWGYFAAASVLVSIPLSIVFLYLQRFFKSGLTVGSVKG
jgi:arabinogalactan oligomer/maltooligosaccharide transport system permease protein